MNPTITFYIVRHGKTLMNTLNRVQGWCDSPLTDEGIEIAKCLGTGFDNIRFEAVYTSDLRRTSRTAQIILKECGQENLSVNEKEELREACVGSYESDSNMRMWRDASLYLGYSDPEKMYKDVFDKKITYSKILNAICDLDILNMAESFEKVELRTQKVLCEIAQQESLKEKDINILIVSHGMSIIAMLHNMGGKELLKSHLENAAVCKVVYNDHTFTVESMGDMGYMEKGRDLRSRKTV